MCIYTHIDRVYTYAPYVDKQTNRDRQTGSGVYIHLRGVHRGVSTPLNYVTDRQKADRESQSVRDIDTQSTQRNQQKAHCGRRLGRSCAPTQRPFPALCTNSHFSALFRFRSSWSFPLALVFPRSARLLVTSCVSDHILVREHILARKHTLVREHILVREPHSGNIYI